jgi:hypothetical protein
MRHFSFELYVPLMDFDELLPDEENFGRSRYQISKSYEDDDPKIKNFAKKSFCFNLKGLWVLRVAVREITYEQKMQSDQVRGHFLGMYWIVDSIEEHGEIIRKKDDPIPNFIEEDEKFN